jgi:pyruvate dehydrogenase E1 component alpha subunit
MPGSAVDASDVEAVFNVAATAVSAARRGDGPALVELKTYRWKTHSAYAAKDPRPEDERDAWIAKRDPIAQLGIRIVAEGLATEGDLDRHKDAAATVVNDAITRAKESPAPDAESATTDVIAVPQRFGGKS